MRLAPLIVVLPLFGCDQDSGPHFAHRPQSWTGTAVIVGQHEWIVTASAMYVPSGLLTVEGEVTSGPPGQTILFEVALEDAAHSGLTAIPLASWDDPMLGKLGAALVRDQHAAWPKALARNRVAILVHGEG